MDRISPKNGLKRCQKYETNSRDITENPVKYEDNKRIYTRKNKNFPYKRHISFKIRRDLAKTHLVSEQP